MKGELVRLTDATNSVRALSDEKNRSSREAIDKNEKFTAESVKALADRIEDVKKSDSAMGLQINGIVRSKAGEIEQRSDNRDTGRYTATIITVALAVVMAVVTAIGYMINMKGIQIP